MSSLAYHPSTAINWYLLKTEQDNTDNTQLIVFFFNNVLLIIKRSWNSSVVENE